MSPIAVASVKENVQLISARGVNWFFTVQNSVRSYTGISHKPLCTAVNHLNVDKQSNITDEGFYVSHLTPKQQTVLGKVVGISAQFTVC